MMNWLHDAQYSLVLFTLFTQASVGAFWVLLVSDFLKRKAPDAIQDAFTRIGTYILVPLTAVGLIFSTTHLGRPIYAWRALRHIDSSWLSREIWGFGLFFGLVALYTFLWWKRINDAELRRHIGVVTGIVGVLAIVSQIMVYQIPGRPTWNHLSTFPLFGASGLILGPLAVAVVYSIVWGRFIDLKQGEATVRLSHRRLGITLLSGAVIYAVGLLWRLHFLASSAYQPSAAVAGKAAVGAETVKTALVIGHQIVEANRLMLGLQAALGIGVPALLAVALWYLHKKGASLKLCNALIAAGLPLVALGELAGRALYYLTGRPWF
ncbi:MAG: oxidoreductase similar to anaerobic dimethyl sulfoxide reductase subunit [Symbiobacteriaceae bacterium]|jgi:anaerobic dimethyl sulfoxide reductase subunit C (anchor subunit)|nr:oxidoreductase similar to anaerobic dimethyl sulfoxide reductase subunit [Symbiobacteriaceae bacterium]